MSGGKAGRLEAQHYFAANVTATWTESNSHAGAPFTVTVTAGSYYMVELTTAINAQLTSSVAISDGEGTAAQATGLATITASSGTVAVTWVSTSLRDALGFSANFGAAASATGSRACPGVWLPGCPAKFSRHGDSDAGTLVTSFRQTKGPTGTVYSIGGSSFREINGLLWEGVPGQRVRPNLATYTNETLEEFLGNTVYGTGTYATFFLVGASNRIYWDADVDGTYLAGKFLWPGSFDPDTMIKGWTGRYVLPFPNFVVGA